MIISSKLFIRLLLVLLIAAVWSVLGCGGGSSPTAPAMPAMGSAGPAVITGQVVSRGAALDGVKVRVKGADLSSVTDAGGNFDLVGVPAGDQMLKFEHADKSAELMIDNVRPAEQIDMVVALRGSNANLKSMHRSSGGSDAPSIDLEKSTNGEDADLPPGPVVPVGDPVVWDYFVENTGDVALESIMVSDDRLGMITTCPQNTLAPGESMTCSVSGTAQLGQYENLGSVTAIEAGGSTQVDDNDLSHYLGTDASIDIEKSTNGEDADLPPGPSIPVGDPVNWDYVVTNDGGSDLANVTVIDDQGVAVTCPTTTLLVGESMTCTATGTAVEGQYANLGTASGEDVNGAAVSDEDPSHYLGEGAGGGGALTVDIQSDHWNTNWPGSNGKVSAKIHGGDLTGIDPATIIMFETDPTVFVSPVNSPRITGNHIRAEFSKSEAFMMLTPPVAPGEVRTITVEFMDNGVLTDLQDDIFIVGPGN